MGRLANIQALRALAALAVVLAHSALPETAAFHSRYGVAGVDLFFVLSGFIIFYVTRDGCAPRTFIAARIIRIFPLYLIVLAVETGAFKELMHFVTTFELRPDTAWCINSILLLPTLSPQGDLYPAVAPAWTLVLEMLFYWVVAISSAARIRLGAASVMLIFAAAFAASFALPGGGWRTYLQYPGAGAIPIYAEFLLGVVVAEVYFGRRLGFSEVAALAVIGIASFAFCPDSQRVLTFGLPSVALLAAALWLEQHDWRASGFFVLLGDASYVIYLIHPYVISKVRPLVAGMSPDLMAAVYLAAATAIGVAVHVAMERPLLGVMRHLMRSNVLKSMTPPPIPGATPLTTH